MPLMVLTHTRTHTHAARASNQKSLSYTAIYWLPVITVHCVSSAPVRELKHRTMKEPDEPKFELKEYVDREMRVASCCRS